MISLQQMRVILPLIQDIVSFLGLTDRIQHIAVTLTVDCLLECLDRQAQIDFIGCDIFTDIWKVCRLNAVQEDKKRKDLIICPAFRLGKLLIIFDVRPQIDLFRYPEIIHSLAVPAADPGVFHIVKIIQVRCISVDHPALSDIRVTVRIK